jgi:[acyl-carrier-protein] S-malonyltransferase
MIARARTLCRAADEILARASETLGRDLVAHPSRGAEAFACNQDVQVGVFLASHLHLTALEALGVRADRSLGLSLGEYNHLVHIGALGFEDALALVAARGAIYDRSPKGMMAAVFPLPLGDLEEVVEAARAHGVI